MTCEVCGKDVFCLYFTCNDCHKPLPFIKECPPIPMHFNPIKSKWFKDDELRINHVVVRDEMNKVMYSYYED